MTNYNSEIGSRLKEARKNMNMTLKELGKRVGLSDATIQRYEAGKIKSVDINLIRSISKVLSVTPEYIMGRENAKSANNAIRVNVYGTVPAGIPIEAIEDIIDWEEIPASWTRGGKEYMALKVQGDSMYPKYVDGDIVLILLQPDCESGQDCVVFVNGYNATLKRVLKNPDGTITLEPYNRIYPPKRYGKEDEPISILGVVKELRRKI